MERDTKKVKAQEQGTKSFNLKATETNASDKKASRSDSVQSGNKNHISKAQEQGTTKPFNLKAIKAKSGKGQTKKAKTKSATTNMKPITGKAQAGKEGRSKNVTKQEEQGSHFSNISIDQNAQNITQGINSTKTDGVVITANNGFLTRGGKGQETKDANAQEEQGPQSVDFPGKGEGLASDLARY